MLLTGTKIGAFNRQGLVQRAYKFDDYFSKWVNYFFLLFEMLCDSWWETWPQWLREGNYKFNSSSCHELLYFCYGCFPNAFCFWAPFFLLMLYGQKTHTTIKFSTILNIKNFDSKLSHFKQQIVTNLFVQILTLAPFRKSLIFPKKG